MKDFYNSWLWKSVRKKRLELDNYSCHYCGDKNNLHVHHIVPRKMGGKDELFNLVTLCPKCHWKDHQNINEYGLASIPSPEYEKNRFRLTKREDVINYCHQMQTRGFDMSTLLSIEEKRPNEQTTHR